MAYRLEALDVLPGIQALAEEMLAEEELAEADIVARSLLGNREEKKWGMAKCVVRVGITPSRPLFYWMLEMRSLPRNTRNCIRYLGDYVDLMVKEMTFELLGKGRKKSLGANSNLLIEEAPSVAGLATKLKKYSDFLYTPGKHDFGLPSGRHHRFTAKEVVLCSYITAILAKEILANSGGARAAVEKDNLYAIGGKWGSSSRVQYWGDPLKRGKKPPPDP